MKVAVFACALVLLTAQVAQARARPAVPVRVRMVVFVGEKVEGTRPDFTWTVSYRGKRYTLYVLNLLVLNGSLTPLDIDAAVSLYQIQFQLAGDKKALQKFLAAPPRQQVLIFALIRLNPAARFLMLDTVEVVQLPTPSPSQ